MPKRPRTSSEQTKAWSMTTDKCSDLNAFKLVEISAFVSSSLSVVGCFHIASWFSSQVIREGELTNLNTKKNKPLGSVDRCSFSQVQWIS